MPSNFNNCGSCPYNPNNSNSAQIVQAYKNKNKSPLSLVNNNSDILLIFEAPGITEWSKNTPLCSKRSSSSAMIFNKALAASNIGKTLSNYDITEAVCCFPGTSGKSKIGKKNADEERLAACFCVTNLKNDILGKRYKKIVCFGLIAYNSALLIYNTFNSIANIPTPIFCNHPNYFGNKNIAGLIQFIKQNL